MKDIDLSRITRIVTHENCADGTASAMILHALLPDLSIDFINYVDRDELPVGPYLFCDMTPSKARAEAFFNAGAVVLDHHSGAMDVTGPFAFAGQGFYATGPGISGATMALELAQSRGMFTGDVVGKRYLDAGAIKLARRAAIYDTFVTDSPEWVEACNQAAAMQFYGPERLLSQTYLSPHQLEVGEFHLKNICTYAESIVDNGLYVMGTIAIFNDAGLYKCVNEVAEIARQKRPEIELMVGYRYIRRDLFNLQEMGISVSLRSKKDGVDCIKIAQSNGGNGHPSAAGFVIWGTEKLAPKSIITVAIHRSGDLNGIRYR